MKTLIVVLILLLVPVSMSVRGETITLLEIDSTFWPANTFHPNIASPLITTVDRWIVDTIPRTFILPKRGSAQMSTTHGGTAPEHLHWFPVMPRVDTVIVHDTVYVLMKPHIDTTWGRVDSVKTSDNNHYIRPHRARFLRAEPDWRHRDSGAIYYDLWQTIERIDTVYEPCGAVRTRKDGE